MTILQRIPAVIVAAILLGSVPLFAGNTGKIVGKVTDATTGEALVGANIQVLGTTRGASTDIDGKYTIIGIPIGSYTVKASQVGYQAAEVTNVKIGADETTSLNFKLYSEAVEVKGVTVTADQMLVNSLTTSSTQTVNAKSIENIPNVKSVSDVIKLQAGVVKQGNNLFLRGGRANEVQYLVDGVPTNDIVGNSELATNSANAQLQALYAGMQSGVIGGGASGLAVSANAIQSVSVQTSGFDADYGNAQSGIINIVTKSGGERYNGSIQARTDRIASSNQNESYGSLTLGGPEPLTKYLLPSLGAKIPGNITFFLSADIDRSDGPWTYNHNQFYNPLERRVELSGFLGGLLNGLGFTYRDNQSNSYTVNSKLKYDISGEDQVMYSYRASLGSGHSYYHWWKNLADSSTLNSNLSTQHVLSVSHFFSANTFLRMSLGRIENNGGNDVAGMKPWDYSSAYQSQDPNNDGFLELGTDQSWYHSNTRVWSARFDFNSQVHPLHLMKTGFEFYFEEINSTTIVRPTVSINDTSGNPIYPPFPDYLGRTHGEYPGYGVWRWNLANYPNHGALFLQDNIEFSGLNLHIGIRYDYLDVGKQVMYDDWVRQWTIAANPANLNLPYIGPDWKTNVGDKNSFLYYFEHGYWSPRISIGYPVTDRIVFYFNYGHFLQFPDRENYFRDPFVLAPNNWIGNPNLTPQRTIQYEAGFEDQFTEDMAFAVHAFYKDIFDYVRNVPRGDNAMPVNFDYASARGFELTFNQSFTGNFSTSLSYSYQIAKGRASNPYISIIHPEFSLPRETRLSYDQNHTLNLFITYRVSPREEGKLFGLPFVNNYGVSLTMQYGSGFPYTPYNPGRTERTQYLVNSETMPYTVDVNLTMYKGFMVMDKLNLLLTLDITNLINRNNVTSINPYTGQPQKYGDIDAYYNLYTPHPWYQAASYLNPQYFSPSRQIIFGVKLNWE